MTEIVFFLLNKSAYIIYWLSLTQAWNGQWNSFDMIFNPIIQAQQKLNENNFVNFIEQQKYG